MAILQEHRLRHQGRQRGVVVVVVRLRRLFGEGEGGPLGEGEGGPLGSHDVLGAGGGDEGALGDEETHAAVVAHQVGGQAEQVLRGGDLLDCQQQGCALALGRLVDDAIEAHVGRGVPKALAQLIAHGASRTEHLEPIARDLHSILLAGGAKLGVQARGEVHKGWGGRGAGKRVRPEGWVGGWRGGAAQGTHTHARARTRWRSGRRPGAAPLDAFSRFHLVFEVALAENKARLALRGVVPQQGAPTATLGWHLRRNARPELLEVSGQHVLHVLPQILHKLREATVADDLTGGVGPFGLHL